MSDDRQTYEPPRVLRLGDARMASGGIPAPQCLDGSGDFAGCQTGPGASNCLGTGNSPVNHCDGAGNSAGLDCLALGTTASRDCYSDGESASIACLTGSGGS